MLISHRGPTQDQLIGTIPAALTLRDRLPLTVDLPLALRKHLHNDSSYRHEGTLVCSCFDYVSVMGVATS
jgi:hypothetical protein